MKKRLLRLQMLLSLSVCAIMSMSSCSDDPENGGTAEKGPDAPSVKMVITSMYGGYDNSSVTGLPGYDYDFKNAKYDSQGRPISYENNGIKYTYSYSDSEIIITSNQGTETLSLSSGIIVDNDFSYNSNNQLIKFDYLEKITWENGNPVKCISNGPYDKETCEYEYYTETNTIGFLPGLTYSTEYMAIEEHPLLQCAGFYGATPKNLLKSIYYDGELDRTFTYTDYNEYGYPCTMKVIDSDGDTQTYTFTWEKL